MDSGATVVNKRTFKKENKKRRGSGPFSLWLFRINYGIVEILFLRTMGETPPQMNI